jgi:hypothetical protein
MTEGDVPWTVKRGVPQILESVAASARRWGLLPELNGQVALRMLGVLIDRLLVSPSGEMASRPAWAGVSRMLVQERSGSKIQGRRRDRLAVVRQSSRQQVTDHQESTRLQYRLA